MTESDKNPYQVSFLPWAGLDEEITIGTVTFCPWNNIDKNNLDTEIINWLDNYFKKHVNYKNEPVDTIVICWIDKLNFRELEKYEEEIIHNAANALTLSILGPKAIQQVISNPNEILNSLNFLVTYQNFDPGHKTIAIQEGDVINTLIKFEEARFQKPWSVVSGSDNPDEKIIEIFDRLFKSNDTQLKNRIFRSLEWFFFSHIQSDYLRYDSKIVMMATAFEILLGLEESKKSLCFATKLTEMIATDDFEKNKREKIVFPLVGCWGYDFYKLRNAIVHGDEINNEKLIYLRDGHNCFA